jgi:hypothetical protein
VPFADCSREPDLIDALTTDQWPDRCDEDLKGHVAACESCRDLIAVLAPLNEAWAGSRADAHVPASGMVWWRAQMRARQEAARAASRPITVVQVIAMLAGAAVIVAGLVVISPWLASSFASSRGFLTIDVRSLQGMAGGWLLAGGAAAILAIGSLALYLVVAED